MRVYIPLAWQPCHLDDLDSTRRQWLLDELQLDAFEDPAQVLICQVRRVEDLLHAHGSLVRDATPVAGHNIQ